MAFERKQIHILRQRINEQPQSMIVVAGPRQIGKSTMVRQALKQYSHTFIATDQPGDEPFNEATIGRSAQTPPDVKPTVGWIIQQWMQARAKAKSLPQGKFHILALDEIQKIPRWSEVVKGLWDTDRAEQIPLHIILLGSSPWLMQKGLTESLAGRYESIYMAHWSYTEMQEAFDFSLDEYVYFGGYPGSAKFIREEHRWRQYVRDSLIRPNIEHDILQMTRIDKPSLLKNLFELGCGSYSGQIISYTKLLGQLQDAGNTVTLAHYLDLLSQAGLLTGLKKYAGQEHRQRASPPKMNTHNTALISALGDYSFSQAKEDRSYWGRLVESTVGTHLINNKPDGCKIFYWRESPDEVDFVVTKGKEILAIEVKSGTVFSKPKGLEIFAQNFKNVTSLIVGEGGVALHEFLTRPVGSWFHHVEYALPEKHIEHEARQHQEDQYHRQPEASRLLRAEKLSTEISKIRTGSANSALLYELAGVWLGLYVDTYGDTPSERFKNYCEHSEEVFDAAQAGFIECVFRKDLPTVKEIISLKINQREHFLGRPCLVGMDLKWKMDVHGIDMFDEQILKRMISFRLTNAIEKEPDWFIYLVEHKPEWVAVVLYDYVSRALAVSQESIEGIHQLGSDLRFQQVALLVVPKLLRSFPIRIKSTQLPYLELLLKSALRYQVPDMLQLIERKMALKSMDVSQKIHWLIVGMLIAPKKYEQLLWKFVEKSWQRTNSISGFLRNLVNDLPIDTKLSAQSLSKLNDNQFLH